MMLHANFHRSKMAKHTCIRRQNQSLDSMNVDVYRYYTCIPVFTHRFAVLETISIWPIVRIYIAVFFITRVVLQETEISYTLVYIYIYIYVICINPNPCNSTHTSYVSHKPNSSCDPTKVAQCLKILGPQSPISSTGSWLEVSHEPSRKLRYRIAGW